MDGDAFKLLRNAADPWSFEQYGDCKTATGIQVNGRTYNPINGHKTLGISFLDLDGA
jgi:hypothetical protein